MLVPPTFPYLLVTPLTVDERTAVDTLKSVTALGDDADVVRLAVWRLAEHYSLRLPLVTFAIGSRFDGRNPRRRTGADRRVLVSSATTRKTRKGNH
jgi:hypothetical protein